MLKLIGKGKNAILGAQTVLNWTFGQVNCNYNLAFLLVRPTPPTFLGASACYKDQPNILQHQEETVSSVASVWGVTLEEIQAKYAYLLRYLPNILQHQEETISSVSSVSSVWGVTLEEIQAKYVFHPTATTFTTTIL